MDCSTRRKTERTVVKLAVRIGDKAGTTRDIGNSDVFITTDARYSVGEAVTFTMDMPLETSDGVRLHCEGKVIRVEDEGFATCILSTRVTPL